MIGERFVGGLVILLLLPDLSLARNLPASKEMLILSDKNDDLLEC